MRAVELPLPIRTELIGAVSPPEIAVAIMAEITASLRIAAEKTK